MVERVAEILGIVVAPERLADREMGAKKLPALTLLEKQKQARRTLVRVPQNSNEKVER